MVYLSNNNQEPRLAPSCRKMNSSAWRFPRGLFSNLRALKESGSTNHFGIFHFLKDLQILRELTSYWLLGEDISNGIFTGPGILWLFGTRMGAVGFSLAQLRGTQEVLKLVVHFHTYKKPKKICLKSFDICRKGIVRFVGSDWIFV